MVQAICYLIPLLALAVIVLFPFLCFILYKQHKKRTCLVLSHLWCIITFIVAGFVTMHYVRRHQEKMEYAWKASSLLGTIEKLREGKVEESIKHLDEFAAGTLYRSAFDISDDKMATLDPEILCVWQEFKEYYDTYEVQEPYRPGIIPRVREKLASVPWSAMQAAIKKFEQTYGSGQRVAAPMVTMRSWLSESISNEQRKNRLILLDFWNIHCGPCVNSLSDLQDLYNTYQDQGLLVIACAGGDHEETKMFLDEHNYTFPAGMVSEQTYLDYAIRWNPSYFLIDRSGCLAWGPESRLPTDEELKALLEVKQP